MKFSQLIELMKSIFSKNYTQNVMDKLVADSLIKNQNSAYIRIYSLFFYWSKSRTTKTY